MTDFDFKKAIANVAKEDKENKSEEFELINALDTLSASIHQMEVDFFAQHSKTDARPI